MKFFSIIALLLISISTSACTNDDESNALTENPIDKTALSMKIIIGNRTTTVTMENNAAANDLISRLPLDVTLSDFNNTTEKIFYPEPELNTTGATTGCAPIPGDIVIYKPWNNVAIFCKSWPHSDDLIKIGHIDGNGIETLKVPGNVKVRLEK